MVLYLFTSLASLDARGGRRKNHKIRIKAQDRHTLCPSRPARKIAPRTAPTFGFAFHRARAGCSDYAQAFDELEVAFYCRAAPSAGSVHRGTGRPRPRFPIPCAKTGALALHMGGAWVLTETVGSATLEAAGSSTRAVAGRPVAHSPPGSAEPPRAAQSRQARLEEAVKSK